MSNLPTTTIQLYIQHLISVDTMSNIFMMTSVDLTAGHGSGEGRIRSRYHFGYSGVYRIGKLKLTHSNKCLLIIVLACIIYLQTYKYCKDIPINTLRIFHPH